MLNQKLFTLLLLAGALSLTACKQQFPKDVVGQPIFGTVQKLSSQDSLSQMIYQGGEDPTKKNWGLAGAYWVTIDGKQYPVFWEDRQKFLKLKVGDTVNLPPTAYIDCFGESDLKPTCYRLYHVYKSDRRIPMLLIK